MNLKERLTQKVGPLPAWAWGVTAAGVVWVAMKLRSRGKDEPDEFAAMDDPENNLYTLGPVASPGMLPAGNYQPDSNQSFYENPPEWFNEYLYQTQQSQDRFSQMVEDYFWSTTVGAPDPYAPPVDAAPASLPIGSPGSGVSVQQAPAAKKAMTWAQWNDYHSKLDKNWLKIPGATRQGRYYDYLRAHGQTVLPGSGQPIPNITAAAATSAAPKTAGTPSGASPAASTPATRAADRAKKGIMEFDAWVQYQVKTNKNFMKQTTAEQRRDRWRNYVTSHGGQWQ